MIEKDTIDFAKPRPNTVETLVRDLTALGLGRGSKVLVHSSLSALGWTAGGAHAVIIALEQVIGKSGTLVIPAHSSDLSDPAAWENPPVPESWWSVIRDETPAFDRALTATRGMGEIAESFRRQPGVRRSGHPQLSFAAWGRYKRYLTRSHGLAFAMGEGSPLSKFYDLEGQVLLLGTGFDHNSSFHLAEYRASWPGKHSVTCGAPVLVRGKRSWVTFPDIDISSDDFQAIGAAFESCEACAKGKVGDGEARFFSQRRCVDFAVRWIEANRR